MRGKSMKECQCPHKTTVPRSFTFIILNFLSFLFYHCTWCHLPKFLQCIIVEFTPSISLLYYPSPHSGNSLNRSHFSTYIYEYIIFPPHSPSYTLFLHPPPSLWCHPSDRTCFTFLFSVYEKRHYRLC
jgi:hypothetical protein